MPEGIVLNIHGQRIKVIPASDISKKEVSVNFRFFVSDDSDYDYIVDEERLTTLFDTDTRGLSRILIHFLSELLQKQFLFFHGSCVAKNDKAIAFIGPTFSGKTTLALMCNQLGFDILSDDVVTIKKQGIIAKAFPTPFIVRKNSRKFMREINFRNGHYIIDGRTRVHATPNINEASLIKIFLIGQSDYHIGPHLYMLKNSFLRSQTAAHEYLTDIMKMSENISISFSKQFSLTANQNMKETYESLKHFLKRLQ